MNQEGKQSPSGEFLFKMKSKGDMDFGRNKEDQMLKVLLTSLRAIIAGYFISVLGIILVLIALSFTPLKGAYWIYFISSILFILFGGYIASNVSRKYRLINSAAVGLLHIFWALFRGGGIETIPILAIQILAIPLAITGGVISKKIKPVVREIEQI